MRHDSPTQLAMKDLPDNRSPKPPMPDGMDPATGIVYFGNDWFAENRTSSHHIARCLSETFPMLYVEMPGLRSPQATSRDFRKIWRKLGMALQRPRKLGEKFWHLSVPQIPYRRLPFVNRLNRYVGQYLVRRAMREIRMSRPVLWFHVPHMSALLGHLRERFVVYYCIDNYAALPGVDASEIRRMDEDLTRRADQVFVSSQALLEPKAKLNSSALYSPHGVDVELFRRTTDDPSLPVAPAARDLTHPVIGFFGLIETWIDLDLILYLAQARPGWTFLMVGRVAVDVGELAGMKNVIFPGPQPYQTLPQWAKAFDVAIYPARWNEFVRNANPLKIREYLATGRPVVSIWTPEVARFEEHVRIARNYQEFLNRIEETLAGDSDELSRSRQAAVANLTWEARVAEVVQVIAGKLQQR